MKWADVVFISVVALVSIGTGVMTYLVCNIPVRDLYNPSIVVTGSKVVGIGLAVACGLLILLSVMVYLVDRLKENKKCAKKKRKIRRR